MNASITPLGVRLPMEVREKIKAAAVVNRRSMNAEIVVALERMYSNANPKEKGEVTA
jgi:hypothetical protein